MIVGVGIDIVEVDRINEKINKENGFKEKFFSVDEITFCESKKEKSQHYAARFAAKEAFLKATGQGLMLGYTLSDIEVVNDKSGKPELLLRGVFKEYAAQQGWGNVRVSLSHVQSMASAVVIIEQ